MGEVQLGSSLQVVTTVAGQIVQSLAEQRVGRREAATGTGEVQITPVRGPSNWTCHIIDRWTLKIDRCINILILIVSDTASTFPLSGVRCHALVTTSHY